MAFLSKGRDDGRTAGDAIENVIGRSAVVHGDLKAEGAFRIDGTIEGSVESASAVVIGEGGVIRGNVTASEVVVAGQVVGNVTSAKHLDIVATGKVEGDIEAASVRVETGGVFRGTSRMGAGEGDRRLSSVK